MSVRLACEAFGVSETCYRYQAKARAENELLADFLVKLTHNQRNWGFGLCFLYLRNVKGFKRNHKRGYRIYRELDLNLRIKPRKRLIHKQREPLTVPQALNECWSMDFMHDQLADGRSIRLFNVIDDFNRTRRRIHAYPSRRTTHPRFFVDETFNMKSDKPFRNGRGTAPGERRFDLLFDFFLKLLLDRLLDPLLPDTGAWQCTLRPLSPSAPYSACLSAAAI
jgi:hypothetical protein